MVFKLALDHQLLAQQVHDLLVLAITLSMAVVPLVMMALARQLREERPVLETPDTLPAVDEAPQVVVAGMGRMGRAIARMLHAEGVRLVALDTSVEAFGRQADKQGPPVFYGDPSRSQILRAAKAGEAELVIVATDDPQVNLKTVDLLAQQYPHTPVIASVRDHQDVLRLLELGASPVRETFHSSLEMARRAFIALGQDEAQAAAWVRRYQHQEQRWLLELYQRRASSEGFEDDDGSAGDHRPQV